MNISTLSPSTFYLDIPYGGKIESQKLNAFTKSASTDIAAIAALLNDDVIQILSSLPEIGLISAKDNALDGANIYVDTDAASNKDFGLFYNTGQSRPMTIYEAMLFFMQILANTDNGLREGIRIGSYSSPLALTAGVPVEFDWPYEDAMFEPFLFNISGNTVTRAGSTTTVSVNTSTRKISITDSAGTDCYGVIWHPVFTI